MAINLAAADRTVNTVIIIQFAAVVVNLKKKIGRVPINRPIVVQPNASPGLCLKTETSMASVIDIVMLKSITPARETNILLSPASRNGSAADALIIAVFFTPKASAKIPPSAFPAPIAKYRMTDCNIVFFHVVGIPYPI